MKQNYHVTHRSDGNWAVVGEGNNRASSLHSTQGDAIRSGRPLAESAHSELRIHDRQNQIRESWSYGNDPYPPPG